MQHSKSNTQYPIKQKLDLLPPSLPGLAASESSLIFSPPKLEAMADVGLPAKSETKLGNSMVENASAETTHKDISVDHTLKHPLEHSWTFWFDNTSGKSKQSTWGSSLRPVYTFSTVEDFWCLYNTVLQPSRVIHGTDFHCFKAGIQPKWEDPECANGGKWTILSPPRGGKNLLDTYWLHTLLAMIGEQFHEGDEICGAVVSVRSRQDKLALWTKTASNEAAQISTGKQWKDHLDYNEKIGYPSHDDARRQDKPAKPRYMV